MKGEDNFCESAAEGTLHINSSSLTALSSIEFSASGDISNSGAHLEAKSYEFSASGLLINQDTLISAQDLTLSGSLDMSNVSPS